MPSWAAGAAGAAGRLVADSRGPAVAAARAVPSAGPWAAPPAGPGHPAPRPGRVWGDSGAAELWGCADAARLCRTRGKICSPSRRGEVDQCVLSCWVCLQKMVCFKAGVEAKDWRR